MKVINIEKQKLAVKQANKHLDIVEREMRIIFNAIKARKQVQVAMAA